MSTWRSNQLGYLPLTKRIILYCLQKASYAKSSPYRKLWPLCGQGICRIPSHQSAETGRYLGRDHGKRLLLGICSHFCLENTLYAIPLVLSDSLFALMPADAIMCPIMVGATKE